MRPDGMYVKAKEGKTRISRDKELFEKWEDALFVARTSEKNEGSLNPILSSLVCNLQSFPWIVCYQGGGFFANADNVPAFSSTNPLIQFPISAKYLLCIISNIIAQQFQASHINLGCFMV